FRTEILLPSTRKSGNRCACKLFQGDEIRLSVNRNRKKTEHLAKQRRRPYALRLDEYYQLPEPLGTYRPLVFFFRPGLCQPRNTHRPYSTGKCRSRSYAEPHAFQRKRGTLRYF